MDLIAYIDQRNAQAEILEAQTPGLVMFRLTDDRSHWNDMGIFTVEDFQRHELIDAISDASKDLYGCRLRLAWDEMSVEQMEDMYKSICDQLNLQFEEEKAAEAFMAECKKGLPDDCEPLPYEEYAYLETV